MPETKDISLTLPSPNFNPLASSTKFSVNIPHFPHHHYLYSRLENHLPLKLWHLLASHCKEPHPKPHSLRPLTGLRRPSVFWLLLLSHHPHIILQQFWTTQDSFSSRHLQVPTPVWDTVLPDTQLPTSFLSFRSVLTYALPPLVSLPIFLPWSG